MSLTMDEAIAALHKGEKLTHRYFLPDEWVQFRDRRMYFEDGASISENAFWADRKDSDIWDKDWDIYNKTNNQNG